MANLVQQAGIHSNSPEFQDYVAARCSWRTGKPEGSINIDAEFAAEWIRMNCSIQSRKELNTNQQAAQMWQKIVQDFRKWKWHTGRVGESSDERC